MQRIWKNIIRVRAEETIEGRRFCSWTFLRIWNGFSGIFDVNSKVFFFLFLTEELLNSCLILMMTSALCRRKNWLKNKKLANESGCFKIYKMIFCCFLRINSGKRLSEFSSSFEERANWRSLLGLSQHLWLNAVISIFEDSFQESRDEGKQFEKWAKSAEVLLLPIRKLALS
jgi:hypothetical protein